ncbi:four helix bundle protein [Rhodohalobacter sp. 8-1]|uniref:four helix bundle protein n=1 Tax=Rhodohalobacter sp. 8-1 TaxID=3131972 RepID=UPI00403FA884
MYFPALNYGETQSAISKRDFINKMNIVLRELRESLTCLTIIKRLLNDPVLAH